MKIGAKICVVSNELQYFLAVDQLEECAAKASFVLESAARNTAAAIALAALAQKEETVMLVVASDHLIENEKAYEEAVARAEKLAREGYLVTFGIKPTAPETGYGYIKANGESVSAFVEKPDETRAKEYLSSGEYLWNSGMFCFCAGTLLEEMRRYAPDIYNAAKNAFEAVTNEEPLKIALEDMLKIPSNSIDYAVMEKSQKVRVVACDIGWSDLGSFESLYEAMPKDENGNTVTNAITIEAKNNAVITSERLVALVGVEDLMIVDTPDALLVAKRGYGQKVKDIVAKLREQNSELHNIHLTVHRPWGEYTILEEGARYKVKKIVVKPGKRLSLQKHFHRNEHWIVIEGTARIVNGESETVVRTNESTYIPMGQAHRLENPGRVELVLLEAQVGEYLGEDDIVRLNDDYNRI
jgi:mannose-1-phosphate guanylyltransferase